MGVTLFAGSMLWAWTQQASVRERERDQLVRYAASLAKGLEIVAQRLDVENPASIGELRVELHERLRLAHPFRFVLIMQGDEILADQGAVPPLGAGALEPGVSPDGRLFVVRVPLFPPGPPPPPDPGSPRRPPPPDDLGSPPFDQGGRPRFAPPWEWSGQRPLEDGPGPERLELVVGFDPSVNPRAFHEFLLRTAAILLVAWAGIVTLVLAGVRSIRSRELVAALDAERRERARLSELNLAATGLAHETENPLGLILGLAQRLRAAPDATEGTRDAAEQILDAADRAAARLSDFINFARIPAPRLADGSIREIAGRVVAALAPDFDEAGVHLACDVAEIGVRCDPSMLEQVLANLLLNSLQASGPGSTTTVQARRHGTSVTLSVVDQGRGVAPDLLPEIFEPYVTGRPDGHGLGLAIVKRIADQHGWAIAVSGTPGGGATFEVSKIRVAARTEPSP